MPEKLKLLIIDKDKNTVIVDVDRWLFERLQIKNNTIKQHESKSSLNKEVTDFLNSFGND